MDDPHKERLQPINPPAGTAKTKPPSSPFEVWAKITRVLAILAGILTLIFCGYLWVGFMENDQGILHLLSAFALCFGTGLLAYGPLFTIAFWAHKSLRTGPKKLSTYLTIFLVLPWMIIGILVFPIGGIWSAIGAAIWLICLYLLFWTALCFHRLRAAAL